MSLIKDNHKITDKMNINLSTPKKTKIIISDHDTGEVLQEVHNSILVPGSQMTAAKQFGLSYTVAFPTYNSELELQHSFEDYAVQPFNTPITCLWCVGRSGYSSSPGEIIAVSNIDRIEMLDDLIPFRYVDPDKDLDPDNREFYFGRKEEPNGKIAYYFKAFDTNPLLHVRYLDGTEVTGNMYNIDSSQNVEIYVEMRLTVNRLDFRDYMDQVLGWDNADISTVQLVSAWYDNTICENPEADAVDRRYYRWYQDILPYSKFNFKAIDLDDLNRAIDFNYQIYF